MPEILISQIDYVTVIAFVTAQTGQSLHLPAIKFTQEESCLEFAFPEHNKQSRPT